MSERPSTNYLIDMDGVLISGNTMIPGAGEFIERLKEHETKFLVLTNNPLYTPRDLAHRSFSPGPEAGRNGLRHR
jgi:NagD protein